MNNKDYQAKKDKHLEYLAKDNYIPDYPADFMRLFYSNQFKKKGYWLIALAEGGLEPITVRQNEFLVNIRKEPLYKKTVDTDGRLHALDFENLYLKDRHLKHNWKELFLNIKSYDVGQKKILAELLGCQPTEDEIVTKIFKLYFKPIFLWDDDESMHYEVSYHLILCKIASKLDLVFDDSISDFALQEKITQKTFSDIISKISPEEKRDIEKKLLKEAESLGINVGSSSIFTLLAAGSLTGFAPYLLVTTTASLISGIIGITLPFGIYTALTSGVSYLLGPVGWIGASIFAISRYKKMNMKKLVPAIVLIHSFSIENKIKKKI